MITHETLHFLKRSGATKHCSMAVKTDMSKAYDRLEWKFIEAVLRRFGFHEVFCGWIMSCITTVTYSVLFNGEVQGMIYPTRGIRQGDPLSPYIFILCSEVLSGLCMEAQRRGSLAGVRVARASPRINHLLFADDTMFFAKTTISSVNALKEVLKKYEAASGQMINTEKSAITFSKKAPAEVRERVKECLGIAKEGGVGKYLGLPEHFGRRKRDLFTSIVDRIRQKAASWSTRKLSAGGKLTMLQSVLLPIPSFSMMAFKLPKGLTNRIQSAFTRYWWDDNPETRKMCWIAWSRVAKPKSEGGLGVRDVEAFNDALLAKQGWRILNNPDCLLAKVMTGKYCTTSSFLAVPASSSCSHGWRSILCGRDLLLQNMGKTIGNGESTKIWEEPWISLDVPTRPIGPPNLSSKDLTVSHLLTQPTGAWDRDKVDLLLPHEAHKILLLKPSRTGGQDKHCWLATKSGEYSTKTGYHTALKQLQPEQSPPPQPMICDWMADIWLLPIPPKIKVFLWKIVQRALPLGDTLASRGIPATCLACTHCGDRETANHLFLTCPFARQIWNQTPIHNVMNIIDSADFQRALKDSKKARNLPPIGMRMGSLFPWICWNLWIARNHKIFQNRCFEAKEVLSKAIADALEWQTAQEQSITGLATEQNTIVQRPPPQMNPDIITVNTDAAWKESEQKAGLAWLFSDNTGRILARGTSLELYVPSPLVAEGMALREALLHAQALGFNKLCIKSDAQIIIRAINRRDPIKELCGILQDILNLSCYLSVSSFIFISRKDNMAADALAKRVLVETIYV
ncbi:hypothetical protein YC2023_025349 [Brassica napus]